MVTIHIRISEAKNKKLEKILSTKEQFKFFENCLDNLLLSPQHFQDNIKMFPVILETVNKMLPELKTFQNKLDNQLKLTNQILKGEKI